MPELEFIEEGHIYRVGNVIYPGVTEIIADAGLSDFSMVKPAIMERARAYGKAVHKMAELWLLHDLNEETLDKGLRGPLQALKSWYAEYAPKIAGEWILERPAKHRTLKYCGTPDILGPYDVIDIKSRKVDLLKDGIQLAGYDHLDGNGKRKRWVLELKQDGIYVFTLVNPTRHSAALAWSRFRHLLTMYEMEREVSLWK